MSIEDMNRLKEMLAIRVPEEEGIRSGEGDDGLRFTDRYGFMEADELLWDNAVFLVETAIRAGGRITYERTDMATCTLTFEDTDGGEVTANIAFSPALELGEPCPILTPSQSLGMRVLEASFVVLKGMEYEEMEEGMEKAGREASGKAAHIVDGPQEASPPERPPSGISPAPSRVRRGSTAGAGSE